MVKKEREIPLRLIKEEALLRRLLPRHRIRKEIDQSVQKRWAGFRGEKELDYHLSFLPEKKYFLFQGLDFNGFQIDSFVLSPHFGLLIECKNLKGTLHFQSHQLIRTFKGEKEGFPHPLLQVQRQQIQFKKWLTLEKIKPFPLYHLVAICSHRSVLESDRLSTFDEILLAERIPFKIEDMTKKNPQRVLSSYQISKLSDLLITHHKPGCINLIEYFHLSPDDLILGISCPRCTFLPMQRVHGKWKCRQCLMVSYDAHEQVILDHLLLFGSLTNSECQNLLQISSPDTTGRLLSSMDLPYQGLTKGRIYLSPK